jgi:hypothetical protein
MSPAITLSGHLNSVGSFLRAESSCIRSWIVSKTSRLTWFCVVAIVAGAGLYGAAIGSWREPLQSLYTGIKLPLAACRSWKID